MIVLARLGDERAVGDDAMRALALRRLEFMASEDLLGGDAPSSVVVMEVGDRAPALSQHLGFDVLAARYSDWRYHERGYVQAFETLDEHPTFFEMVFVLSDYGDGVVVVVPKQEGVDADLLALCAMHSVMFEEPRQP